MDSNILNLTPFECVMLPTERPDGAQGIVVVTSACFELPDPSRQLATQLKVMEEQPTVPLTEEWWGEPGLSSLKMEGQTTYQRPGTDIYVSGSAWAPKGRPTQRSKVRLRIAELDHQVLILGNRVWRRRFGGLYPSSAKRFENMPLRWERSFGGPGETGLSLQQAQALEHNPVGVGFHLRSRDADGQPLPNLERADQQLEEANKPVQPIGLGPIFRSWRPRRGFAGTYDEAWERNRAPLWPKDFDERYFCAAAPGLRSEVGLVGGEACSLEGFHPDGAILLNLPRLRLQAKVQSRRGQARSLMALDGVNIDTDQRLLTLIYRRAFWLRGGALSVSGGVVRCLKEWEESPQSIQAELLEL